MAMSKRQSQCAWHFDPAYTTVEFVIRNLWFEVRGRFRELEGVLVLDEDDVSRSSVTASIRAGSIDTGNKRRDGHLLLRDFFDLDRKGGRHTKGRQRGRPQPNHARNTNRRRSVAQKTTGSCK